MANITEYSRLLFKRTTSPGVIPTVPTGTTIDSTWLPTDILPGEGFINLADDRLWFRTSTGIVEVSLSGASVGNITTGATLVGDTIYFETPNSASAYTVDLSSIVVSGGTSGLPSVLAVDNTTGSNWIKPAPLFGLLSEEDTFSYTIKFDPAGYDGGTTFISTYPDGEISTITQNPTNIKLDCYDGVELKSGANLVDTFGVINSIFTSSSDILLSSSDIVSTITDTIILDAGLSLIAPRTGIKSENTTTGNVSQSIYTPNTIISTATDVASTIIDTISVDPQGLTGGTGIKSENTTTGDNIAITINPADSSYYGVTASGGTYGLLMGQINGSDCETIQIITQDATNTFGASVFLESQDGVGAYGQLSSTDIASTIMDTISVDPQGLYNGTGIKSIGPSSVSEIKVQPSQIIIDSSTIKLPSVPSGTIIGNLGLDSTGKIVTGSGTGGGGSYLPLTVTGTTFVNVDNNILYFTGNSATTIINAVVGGDSNSLTQATSVSQTGVVLSSQNTSTLDSFYVSSNQANGSSLEYNTGSTVSIFKVNKSSIRASSIIPTFAGITYDIDYSANYTNRSLIDKQYVDNKFAVISGGGSIWTAATYGTNAIRTKNGSTTDTTGLSGDADYAIAAGYNILVEGNYSVGMGGSNNYTGGEASGIFGGQYNITENATTRTFILGGYNNIVKDSASNSGIIGGDSNSFEFLNSIVNSVVIGGNNIEAKESNTVYVPALNIGTTSGSPISNVFLTLNDANVVVTANTSTSLFSYYIEDTITGFAIIDAPIKAKMIVSGGSTVSSTEYEYNSIISTIGDLGNNYFQNQSNDTSNYVKLYDNATTQYAVSYDSVNTGGVGRSTITVKDGITNNRTDILNLEPGAYSAFQSIDDTTSESSSISITPLTLDLVADIGISEAGIGLSREHIGIGIASIPSPVADQNTINITDQTSSINFNQNVSGSHASIELNGGEGVWITAGTGVVQLGGDVNLPSILTAATPDYTLHLNSVNNIVKKPALNSLPCDLSFAITDETTAITTGANKLIIYAPYAFTITNVYASLSTSGSTSSAFDVNKNGTSIFSTTVTIDANEFHSKDATTQPVISTTSVAQFDKLSIDIDTAGTGAKGAKIYIVGTRAI